MQNKIFMSIMSLFTCLSIFIMGVSVFNSCQSVSQSLDEMSEADFQILHKEIYLVTKIAARNLFESKPEQKTNVEGIFNGFSPYLLDNTEPETIAIMSNFTMFIDSIEDPDVKDLINLAMLQIQKYGGLHYVNDIDLGVVLSVRSVSLIQALVEGVLDAAQAN